MIYGSESDPFFIKTSSGFSFYTRQENSKEAREWAKKKLDIRRKNQSYAWYGYKYIISVEERGNWWRKESGLVPSPSD